LNILVPVKHVVDVELNLRVRDGKLIEEGLTFVLSRWDENALEAALQLKEAAGGEVTAVTIGPERAGESLRKALAMGADQGIHVSDPAAAGSDSLGFAKILAAVAKKHTYELIFCGRQSQDTDMGGTGPMLAELLGIPFVANVVQVGAGEAGRLQVHRNGDAGREVLDVALPVLLTANDSLNEPRLASLRGIMAAKKKPLETLTLADLGVDPSSAGAAGAKVGVTEFLPLKGRKAGQKFEGDPAEITRKVVDLLVNEAKAFG